MVDISSIRRLDTTNFSPWEALLLRLLSIIYGDVVVGRHADDLRYRRRRRIRDLLVDISVADVPRGGFLHLGKDFLLCRFKQAQHGRAAGALGVAARQVGADDGFDDVVLLDQEGDVESILAAAGRNVD
jgi:hypothetical protein